MATKPTTRPAPKLTTVHSLLRDRTVLNQLCTIATRLNTNNKSLRLVRRLRAAAILQYFSYPVPSSIHIAKLYTMANAGALLLATSLTDGEVSLPTKRTDKFINWQTFATASQNLLSEVPELRAQATVHILTDRFITAGMLLDAINRLELVDFEDDICANELFKFN